jgi:hypothetical protein
LPFPVQSPERCRESTKVKSSFFPDVPGLRQSLSKIIVADVASNEGRSHEVVCPREVSDAPTKLRPEWCIQTPYDIAVILDNGASLSLDAICSIVSNALVRFESTGLESIDQADLRRIAMLFIAIAKLTTSRDRTLQESLEFVFRAMSTAKVRLIAATKCLPDDKTIYRFGNYQFGWLDLDEIKKLTLHAGSDYFQLHRKKLEGTTALVQDKSVFVLDACEPYFVRTFERKGNESTAILYRLLLASCASDYLPSRMFRLFERATTRVAIFHRKAHMHGWVAPSEHSWSFYIPRARSLLASQTLIEDGLRIKNFGEFPLDGILERYSAYLADAREYLGKDRAEVSLLHYVFALDLLLGGKPGEPLSSLIKDRTATVTFLAEGEPLESIAKFLGDCYEFRSTYAHRGGLTQKRWHTPQDRVLGEKVQRLLRLTRIVFASACWARAQPWCKSVDDWIARIDIMRLKQKANISTEEDVATLGLERIRQTIVGDTTIYTLDWDEAKI